MLGGGGRGRDGRASGTLRAAARRAAAAIHSWRHRRADRFVNFVKMLGWSDEDLFKLLNGVLPAWALLLLAPRWRGTGVVVKVTALVYSVMYVATLVASTQSPGAPPPHPMPFLSFHAAALGPCPSPCLPPPTPPQTWRAPRRPRCSPSRAWPSCWAPAPPCCRPGECAGLDACRRQGSAVSARVRGNFQPQRSVLCSLHPCTPPLPARCRRTHYVVFDLWTAWWELQDAQRRAVPQVRRPDA